MTPFIEQQGVWTQISNPLDVDGDGVPDFNPFGPTPENINYTPWTVEIPTYRCPSDPGVGLPALGRTNYVACMGDSSWRGRDGSLEVRSGAGVVPYPEDNDFALRARAKNRGFFKPHNESRFRDILDGLSNTIAAGEIATDLGDRDIRTQGFDGNAVNENSIRNNPSACSDDTTPLIDPARPGFWLPGADLVSETSGRGFRWADYLPNFGTCYAILPPNRENCTNSHTSGANAPMSSRHQGGAHVLMGDGAVIFMTDSVEAGNSRQQMVWDGGSGDSAPGSRSPYGLWGALGTAASQETVEEQLNQ